MSMWESRIGVRVFCSLLLLTSLGWAQAPQTADQKLALGDQLVNDNCSECEDRSMSEYDRGVGLIEQALREGVKDRRKALLLLADSYGEYAYSYDKQRPMSDATRRERGERILDVYRELLRDNPNDIPVLLLYASSQSNRQDALPIFQHVLRIQPGNADAMFGVAFIHVEAGNVKTSVKEFISALRLDSASREQIENLLPQFVQDLRAREGEQCIPEVSAAAARALKERARPKAPINQPAIQKKD
jgi:cytochrome c-type biogenesis protein CcmH/NrfG